MYGGEVEQPIIPLVIAIGIALFAVALLFIFPYREVTQPPGKRHWVWEMVFPGTAPLWHVFGGLVLIAWTYLVIQDLCLIFIGTPYLITGISIPSTVGYGVPDPARGIYSLINPSWVWVYLAPAVLFAVNLVLVLRARRRA
jgi:hypothetical protein